MIKDLFDQNYIVLDGAMGTMLQKSGEMGDVLPEVLNIEKPELITSIHKAYIDAGANVVYANTFGANRYKMKDAGYSVEKLIGAAINNAKNAIKDTGSKVALDMGPIGKLLEPLGDLSFEEAYDIFKEEVIAGKDADLIVIETMTDLLETKAAVLAAKENSDKPVMVTMTFEENRRTFTGVSIPSMCHTLEGLGVDALGVNCSLGPKELLPIVEEIVGLVKVPVIVKANAGLPDPVTNEYSLKPEDFASNYKEMRKMGVKVFGGCCGTNPDYIVEISKVLKETEVEKESVKETLSVCSATKTVDVDRPRIIGERINPTGKKRFKQALIEQDMNYILSQAIEQVDAGADILDVNVGLPEIDEPEMMVKTIKALQAVVDVPLQLDSSDPEAIEAGLRVYNGKPIINSVNGDDEVLDSILPIVKKYGASVIGLTLDSNGIPKTVDDRINIAKKIMDKALSYGIDKKDIIIDCLTMTVATDQNAAKDTLRALKYVKEELGLRTVLGVSNVSFGMPNRPRVNQVFLQMALNSGLDLPIINPNIPAMTDTVKNYSSLEEIDIDNFDFFEYANIQTEEEDDSESEKITDPKEAILYAMQKGMSERAKDITKDLLETETPMEIINEYLIPSLDKIGEEFEKGTLFLPQLIMAADTAKDSFDVIKTHLANTGEETESKGKIIVATVKGDIHDIGKNIVKVILENYGYDVIDLGRDVSPEEIVETTKKENCKLVGLSALMTTTLPAMIETIEMLDEIDDCNVMVGGAVLTEDYAMQIGADYYSKDAKMSVDIAKEVLG